jgi:1-aminocyclopropane-1-carboxylate deaminase
MNDFYRTSGIPLDIVYTSKLFFAIEQLANAGFFPDSGKVLIIHSGGLQGNISLEKGTLIY